MRLPDSFRRKKLSPYFTFDDKKRWRYHVKQRERERERKGERGYSKKTDEREREK